MSCLLEIYQKAQEFKNQLLELKWDTKRTYQNKKVIYNDEEYVVLVIDIIGDYYGYPCVKLQSVKQYGIGYVKGVDLSIEEFQKLL